MRRSALLRSSQPPSDRAPDPWHLIPGTASTAPDRPLAARRGSDDRSFANAPPPPDRAEPDRQGGVDSDDPDGGRRVRRGDDLDDRLLPHQLQAAAAYDLRRPRAVRPAVRSE